MVQKKLSINFLKKVFVITYHPVTLKPIDDQVVIKELLEVLATYENYTLIFTMPNADTGNNYISQSIKNFVDVYPNAFAFKSLGQHLYFSLIKHANLVVGNSSSGLLEVPFFKKPTINIGDRQKGRLRCSSIIDCDPDYASIKKSIDIGISEEFNINLNSVEDIYGKPGAPKRIVQILKKINFQNALNKSFYKNK